MVKHLEQQSYLLRWDDTKILKKGMGKKKRKALEAAFICINDVSNDREGFCCWAKTAAIVATSEHKRGRDELSANAPGH